MDFDGCVMLVLHEPSKIKKGARGFHEFFLLFFLSVARGGFRHCLVLLVLMFLYVVMLCIYVAQCFCLVMMMGDQPSWRYQN